MHNKWMIWISIEAESTLQDFMIRNISVAVGSFEDAFILQEAQICSHNVTASGLEAFIICDQPVTGQYVSLSKLSGGSPNDKLTLCDIQLYGKRR